MVDYPTPKEEMPNELIERWVSVIGGFLFGAGGSVTVHPLINNIVLDINQEIFVGFLMKIASTVILGAIGAIVGLISKDLYSHKIKPWLFKTKTKKDERNS